MLSQFKNSPLWLIGLFVLFAEATSSSAAILLDGWPQEAMVIFVISYTTLVTVIFFVFLWKKPENVYAPSEYGSVAPEQYMTAIRGIPNETRDAVAEAEQRPSDADAKFALVNSLLNDELKQHLILISRIPGGLDISRRDPRGFSHHYQLVARNNSISVGMFSSSSFLSKLKGTEFVSVSSDGERILLTPLGAEFVAWLVKNQKDAKSFWTDYGGWGEKKTLEDVLRESFPQSEPSDRSSLPAGDS